MLQALRFVTCAAVGFISGCTRPSRPSSGHDGGTGETARGGTSVNGAAGWTTPGIFSAPIAATRVGAAAVVAGLVAAEGSLRAMKIAGEKIVWTSSALGGVEWVPDAELRVQPAGDGVALVWRGLHRGKSGRTLVVLGSQGETLGEPIEIGTAFCGTRVGVAWLDPHGGGSTHVRSRRWAETEIRDVMSVSADRDPALLCGDQDVVVLGGGDNDLLASSFAPGDVSAQKPWVAIRDSDFADDDEREHDAYSMGDNLGLVRIGGSGAIAMREAVHRGPPGPWRRLRHGLAADDDVVAVDGDSRTTLIVFTREAGPICPESGAPAESVRVLRIDRTRGEESIVELAPPDCARTRGAFWIAPAPAAPVVAWVERFVSPPPDGPPIAGLVFRVVGLDSTRPGSIEQPADALTEATCDERSCWAAALVRTLSKDGMSPESIRLLAYP